jgi:predicted kinase
MEMVLFIGLQASGKSTFFHARFAQTHVRVSKDQFPNNKNKDRRQQFLIETALREEHSVVVDNTNPTAAARQPLIALGQSLGATVIGYYFESRLEDCLQRNQLRQGKSRVPDVALYATIKQLQRPTYAEGFHQLFHVRLVGTEGHEVTDWVDEVDNHETRGH